MKYLRDILQNFILHTDNFNLGVTINPYDFTPKQNYGMSQYAALTNVTIHKSNGNTIPDFMLSRFVPIIPIAIKHPFYDKTLIVWNE